MNLREDKLWSYVVFFFIIDARGQRPFLAFAPVQTNKTKESIVEIKKELTDVTSSKPITEEEFLKNKKNKILSLPGSWETMNAVENSIRNIVAYGLPQDYYKHYSTGLRNTSLEEVDKAANEVINPDKLVWVIVGDRSKIEEGIKSLNYGDIKFLDSDGNIIK